MSEYTDVSEPLIAAVVDDRLNYAHSDRVALEEQQRAVEEEADSDDDFVVASEITALLL